MGDAVVGSDGVARCAWAESSDEMRAYHDTEWGRPVRDERGLFERLTLEAFQSGLSWAIVLRKRPRFREVFAGFDAEVVAAYDTARVAALLSDVGIIRNRAKVEATIANARAIRALDGGFADLVWSFAPEPRPRPLSMTDVPAVTPESTALAAGLKRQGFRFVGPTTAYAMMQAVGMVDDHLAGCQVRTDPV
ncbi:DNA-3-methyladenine glycosylase I [Mumia sp. zg.B53]|uniref:DNA-3-methyladenine glycosylase I n=1 Tax=unclassified Mumia TaxID=2621872 RepID=UPI001C6E426F|nr:MULTISPECIES: DNA-3-methyladenine glycosylase I [unclassified Mumia]MBW9210920.1 DNA-3-methyladenine glycosylase I [Mumia sp. zg.B21]MBW9215486.1 DNA-3-methyladenine glycosylase I [Mumia sp. zg.B53]MDD9348826.1 DNA-3-methyladenine glycosylase I [Mumia sp.]